MSDRDERGGAGVSAPPRDCTVLSLAVADGALWAATDAGLWRGCGGIWQLWDTPPVTPIVSAFVRAGDESDGLMLAAGMIGGVQYSVDRGAHWYEAWVDEATSGVTCFAVSPRFAVDRVVLAGTEQDGVLRSIDGGRRWRLANFGLTGYTILAIAAPLEWGRREEVFAITEEGIYRSPNGGRAWQRADEGFVGAAQALAISPWFAADRTLYLGCEGAGLYRSIDAGRSWHLRSADLRNVNSLWIAPDDPQLLVAGTGDGEIMCSTDGGTDWECGWAGPDAVLALAEHQNTLYAGLYQGGLLVSSQRGTSWHRSTER
jgi:photosystem II stability/assembly factor-like uncharacterized protein